MATKLIDSHCHLNYDYAPKSVDDLVREAAEAGIEFLVTVGTEMGTIEEVQKISDRYPNIFHTIGVHPHEASTMKDEDLTVLEAAARHPKCRAVGEIGLDYFYKHSEPESQKKRLGDQLEIALRVAKPIVVHSRDAEVDLLPALTAYARRAKGIPGVIHCFSGTYEFGKACLDAGFYISFSGILTFKTAEDLRTSARAFPLERLLVETDSPYLAPVPYRGKKCEPSMVRMTAMKLAEVRGIELDEVARVTTENAKRVFSLPS